MAYDSSAASAFSGRPGYNLYIYVRRDLTDVANRRSSYAFIVIARWAYGSPRAWDGTSRVCYISVGDRYIEQGSVVLDFRGRDEIIIHQGTTGWLTHDANGYLNVSFAAEMVNAGDFGNARAAGILYADRVPVPPKAPPAPIFSSATTNKLTFTIQAPADNGGATITNYRMQISTTSVWPGDGSTIVADWTSPSSIQSSPAVLQPNTTYYVRYMAINAVGLGAPSPANIAMKTTAGAPSVPRTPQLLDATPTSVLFDWTAPASTNGAPITGYKVARALDPNFTVGYTESTLGNVTERLYDDLAPSTTYYFRVAAINSAGQGPWTDAVSLTTVSGVYLSVGSTWVSCGVFASSGGEWKNCEVFVSDGTTWRHAI
jgi:hypothetical protein